MATYLGLCLLPNEGQYFVGFTDQIAAKARIDLGPYSEARLWPDNEIGQYEVEFLKRRLDLRGYPGSKIEHFTVIPKEIN